MVSTYPIVVYGYLDPQHLLASVLVLASNSVFWWNFDRRNKSASGTKLLHPWSRTKKTFKALHPIWVFAADRFCSMVMATWLLRAAIISVADNGVLEFIISL